MCKVIPNLSRGQVYVFGRVLEWRVRRERRPSSTSFSLSAFSSPYRLHLGPGPNWKKPDNHWIDVDVDAARGDIVVNFQQFKGFPLKNECVQCIYASHVLEHMSIWVTDAVLADSVRVLQPGGTLRLVIPDVERSIREYVAGNADFILFKHRRERAAASYGLDYTLFDCLREDFLSRSQQTKLLGTNALAHQNAWDFVTIARDLRKAGFSEVTRSAFQQSTTELFSFEGTYESEANQNYRSLYVEARKAR